MAESVVKITPQCRQQLTLLAQKARAKRSSEISGMGLAKQLDDATALVYHVWPLKHDSYSGGHVDISQAEINQELARVITLQREARSARDLDQTFNPLHINIFQDFKVWWHSHPPGLETFSGIDLSTIREMKTNLSTDWFVAMLTDGKFVKTLLDVYTPFNLTCALLDAPTLADPTPVAVSTDVEIVDLTIRITEAQVLFDEAKKLYDEANKALNTKLEVGLDELVESCLPPKPVWNGHSNLPGGMFAGNASGPDIVGNKLSHSVTAFPMYWALIEWLNMCERKKCTTAPRFIDWDGTQLCEKHIKNLPKGTFIVFDKMRPEALGAPNQVDLDTICPHKNLTARQGYPSSSYRNRGTSKLLLPPDVNYEDIDRGYL